MSNRLLVPKAHRLLLPGRKLFSPALILPGCMPIPCRPSLADPVTPDVVTFDTGSGNWTVVPYNTLAIELWGGGATGGSPSVNIDGNPTTVSTYSLTAGGGGRPLATATGGAGGTATGGNTTNTNGNPGGNRSGTTFPAYTGEGGDCPNGGTGGARVTAAAYGNPTQRPGLDGAAPGGGGSGGMSLGGPTSVSPTSGGGSGAYVKHVFNAGDPGAPSAGDLIAYAVGALVDSTAGVVDPGKGAAGRVRFTVT